ncbi:MAG: ComF family protein [Verrucomicrobiota bacterium]|nr:ComF family protein [Verrucomicrobiota bacterium]MEC8243711.1 ComF family protein [Verrucomicrobiota bacterium]
MHKKKKWWIPVLNHLFDFFFSSSCPICKGQAFKDGYSYSCNECLAQLAWVKGTRCKLCGISMSGIEFGPLTCSSCREENLLFDEGRCMFLMEEISKNLIHDIKYHGARMILRDMPIWLGHCPGFHEFLEGAVLVPVPLHRRKLKKRGFNQSLWIAKALRKSVGESVSVQDALVRNKNTPTQTELDRKDRKRNVKNAFALRSRNDLTGKDRIILIDDVFTTGATLNSCTQVLKDQGFNQVSIATLGHG